MSSAAQAPRAAHRMTWDEIAGDIEAGRDCLAIVKARVMLTAGLKDPSEAVVRILARLRDPMAAHGFFTRPTGTPSKPVSKSAELGQRVHDGMLRELVAAGALTRSDWLHEASAAHRDESGALDEEGLYAAFCRVFEITDPANAPADWCAWLEGFEDAG